MYGLNTYHIDFAMDSPNLYPRTSSQVIRTVIISSALRQENFQKFRELWHGHTDLAEVPGTGMNVVENSQKLFVRV